MALRRINPRKKHLLLVPRPFSSSSSSNPPFPPPPPPSNDPNSSSHPPSSPAPNHREPPNPASSLFQDIRERLRSSPTPPPPRRIPVTPPRPSGHAPPPSQSLDDIRRTLESYRGSRLSGRASAPSPAGATPSFQDLLRGSAATAPPQAPNAGTKPIRFDTLRESLRGLDPQQQQHGRPHSRVPFLSSIPHNIFGKELGERATQAEGVGKEEDSGIALTRDYSYEELGKRLGELRPAGVGKDGKEWFSLEELQGRIAKLAELEKKEDDPRLGGHYDVLRKSILNLKNQEDKNKTKTMQGMTMLASIAGEPMPEYMLQRLPPQEELLERYFHPDHMSSEEKMKLELQRVRDEFKMSENDCGSARVQIAQLTVKIKHLSAVLHKKDKHSRKGLQDMVQRRKKYLKYLRRTDWDSYCLVLSKLGLRDVPEYKAPDYKSKSTTKAKSKKSKSKSKRKMKA